ncbi:hypothetical protein BJ684DRAFT_16924 [Piptocephalis cylindrospora]|uniref:HAM1-like N-terminal domain-containing protein n=1 Tax=Piptocephalis cylindrospora TaxID=1907219 RepID=A0A4P9Y1R9_9FUNG|nr:hypothetical protein BJ684DRAFT_16924 [Piptocephalis cylindrospora]|eukprot:RKP12604.1 hypothetical protein BJ684DRAFT_16924 [Piptocephalis cylindrospora]
MTYIASTSVIQTQRRDRGRKRGLTDSEKLRRRTQRRALLLAQAFREGKLPSTVQTCRFLEGFCEHIGLHRMAANVSPQSRRVLADVETLLPVVSKFLGKKNHGNWIQAIIYHARIISMEEEDFRHQKRAIQEAPPTTLVAHMISNGSQAALLLLRSKDILPLLMDLYHVAKSLIRAEPSASFTNGESEQGGDRRRRRMRRLIPTPVPESVKEASQQRGGDKQGDGYTAPSLRESIESASGPQMERAHRGELSLPKALAAAAKSIPRNISSTRLTDAQTKRIVTRILAIGAECSGDPRWQEAWKETAKAVEELNKRWSVGRELLLRRHLLGEEVDDSTLQTENLTSISPGLSGGGGERLLRAIRALWKRLLGSELRELWHACEMDSVLETGYDERDTCESDKVKKASKAWLVKALTHTGTSTKSDMSAVNFNESAVDVPDSSDPHNEEEPHEDVSGEMRKVKEREEMISQGMDILRRIGTLLVQGDETSQAAEKLVKWCRKTAKHLQKDKTWNALARELVGLGTDLILPNGQWRQRGILWKEMFQCSLKTLQAIEYWPIPAIEIEDGGVRLALRDIALHCNGLLPDHVNFSVDSHSHLKGPNPSPSEHRVRLIMSGMRVEAKEIMFSFERSVSPRLKDSGLLDFSTPSPGIDVEVTYIRGGAHLGKETAFVSEVRVRVSRVSLRFHRTRREPLIKRRIKAAVESIIAEKIKALLQMLQGRIEGTIRQAIRGEDDQEGIETDVETEEDSLFANFDESTAVETTSKSRGSDAEIHFSGSQHKESSSARDMKGPPCRSAWASSAFSELP